MSLPKHLHLIQKSILTFAFLVFVMALLLDSLLSMERLDNEPISVWVGPWTILQGDTVIAKQVNFPFSLEGPVLGNTYTAQFTIPSNVFGQASTIAVETSMTSLQAYVDGQLVYSFLGPGKGWARPVFGGTTVHFIRMGEGMQGKQLSLVYEFTSNNGFAGRFELVKVGTKARLMLEQFLEWPSFFYGFSLLLLGFLVLIFSLAIQTKEERMSFWYFGWVLLALGGWVFSQTPSKFLFIRNPALPMNFSFAALFFLPFFLTKYIRNSYPVSSSITYFEQGSLLFILSYAIIGILQYMGWLQYTDLLLASGLFLVFFLLAVFGSLVYQYAKGNRQLGSFLLAMACMLLSILSEVVLLAMGIILKNAVILHFGMALSAAILFWHSVTLIRTKTQMLCREKLLLNLAYSDVLTDVGNRAAYEREVENIISANHEDVMGILMMDINDLKHINDTQGHTAGDFILKDFAQRLKRVLPSNSKIFRYGGDEFIALIPHVSESEIEGIAGKVLAFFTSQKVKYQVAVGYDRYIPKKKEKFPRVVSRADEAMYQCKSAMKARPKA